MMKSGNTHSFKGTDKLVNASLLPVFKKKRGKAIFVALSLLAFSIGFSPVSYAANSDLDKLETKFFHHTNPKKDDATRLDRLEKMFFGEAKEGTVNERLNNLKSLVPDLDEVEMEKKKKVVEPPKRRTSKPGPNSNRSQSSTPSYQNQANNQAPQKEAPRLDAGTKYPAITAIEKKKLGKSYEGDPVDSRLARLEKKLFGNVSTSNDFTDRMDRLKAHTGIDVARMAPAGTDWAGDDVEVNYPTPSASRPQQTFGNRSRYGSRGSYGADGKTFSGRDLRRDMQRVFPNRNRTAYGGGSGNYGMNSGRSTGSSGSYGFGGSQAGMRDGLNIGGQNTNLGSSDRRTAFAPRSSTSQYPPTAPPIPRASAGKPLGLNQKVELLESQIFGRNFPKDSLPERVSRLEKTIFPNKNINSRTSLPSRVNSLVGVIPIQSRNLISSNNRQSQNYRSQSQSTYQNQNQPKQRGGLSKVLGAMGNFISGGFSVGSYPMNGNLVTDPQTGLYLDRSSGNLIDPHTGMVVGRKGLNGYNSMTPNYGNRSFNNRSFNNGFAPSINNYRYGGTGTGIRFGTGFGSGGMWP